LQIHIRSTESAIEEQQAIPINKMWQVAEPEEVRSRLAAFKGREKQLWVAALARARSGKAIALTDWWKAGDSIQLALGREPALYPGRQINK